MYASGCVIASVRIRRAARDDRRDRARRERDLHGGDVRRVRVDRRADGGDAHGRRIHEREDDVDVVDHQVHHHRVLLDARDERPQPARLDEDRAIDDLAQLLDGAVESLDVADLERGAAAPRDGVQLARLVQRRRDRLFHEHAHAALEEIARDVEVLLRGHGDARDVDAADEVAVIVERRRFVLRGDRARARGIDVGDADEIDVPQFRVDARVVLPHVSAADDRRAHAPAAERHQASSSPLASAPSAPATPSGAPMMPRLALSMNAMSSFTRGVGSSSRRRRSSAAPGARPLR